MKTRAFLSAIFIAIGLIALAQRENIELKFTAVNNGVHVHLDSIRVMNRTQGTDTMLYYPDTVLLALYYAGIPDNNNTEIAFQVFRNYPNPVVNQTTISLFVPEKDRVTVSITDISGRLIFTDDRVLNQGTHSFIFTLSGNCLYFFTARWKQMSRSIKIICSPFNENRAGSLEYVDNEESFTQSKTTRDIKGFSYSIGDALLYIGYTGAIESGMLDSPDKSKIYTFQFATNIPCPGMPTVEYEGQVYNTIQIFSQCWLKENIKVGTMILNFQYQSNNGILEMYCYNNEPDSCVKHGGLYQWNEMMQYTTQQGAQGICPPGWHLPTDDEWQVLEGAVDSQYGIGDDIWDNIQYRGYDAGKNLKTTSGWVENGNGTDLFGFSGLPGGARYYGAGFSDVGRWGYWWTSSEFSESSAWVRTLGFNYPAVDRADINKVYGFSVRCLRD